MTFEMASGVLLSGYEADVAAGVLRDDPQQRRALQALDRVFDALVATEPPAVPTKGLARVKRLFQAAPALIQGVYLWGGVGIGKTALMDRFFDTLPIAKKRRLHFHHFMREVHAALTRLQGEPSPLVTVAKSFASQARVLCFDEFFVNDITDAMLLAGVLQALFDEGVTLVATSNTAPDNLYYRGLQRPRFLPAIALIHAHTQVLHLSTHTDYRVQHLKQSGVYFHPLNDASESAMQQAFFQSAMQAAEPTTLSVLGRTLHARGVCHDVAWFSFSQLCQPPRGAHDYLELAALFSVILVSDIPVIGPDDTNTLTYLINVIDIFYDNGIIVILSADAPIEGLYPQGELSAPFQRTLSRLHEMQSLAYWHAVKHKRT